MVEAPPYAMGCHLVTKNLGSGINIRISETMQIFIESSS